jgi:hypothetical protein
MKVKSLILIGIAAIITVSFSFVSVNTTTQKKDQAVAQHNNEPLGGFESETVVK